MLGEEAERRGTPSKVYRTVKGPAPARAKERRSPTQKSVWDSSGVMVGGSWREICTRVEGVVLSVVGLRVQPRLSRTRRMLMLEWPSWRRRWGMRRSCVVDWILDMSMISGRAAP